MDLGTFETNLPLETIFVPGCPNIKTKPPDRKPIKEEIFVADLPIITEQVEVKTEHTVDADEKDDTYADSPGPFNDDLPREPTPTPPTDSNVRNVSLDPIIAEVKAEVKEEPDKNETPANINIIKKKKERKSRPRTCDEITPEPRFVCNICTTGFQRINNYTIHMKKKHQIVGEATPYACPNCPRKYEFEYELRRHMLKYTPIEERRVFPCPHCDRKFQTMVHVNRHVRFVHDNTRPFVCEECGEAVHTKSGLKEHMLTHTDFSPFQCKDCGKCFKQKQRLKRHMEIHGEKLECLECGKKLSSRGTLSKHLLVHSEEKPHKCQYCGRAFKLTKTLKVHLNSHTGDKIYNCKFCDKTFTAPSSRRQHTRKKHPEKLQEEEALTAKNIPRLDALETSAHNTDGSVTNMSESFIFNKLPENSTEGYNINNFKMFHNPIDFSSSINQPASTTLYHENTTVL